MTEKVGHRDMANAIRVLAMDAVENANSGHPGMPMGMADVATVLVSQFLNFDPSDPGWPDRDRFVLSAGHGSMLLYALLYLTGYPDMTLDEIKRFRQLGSRTPGHPEYGMAQGVETTTGPLGQGFGNAVGMAIAERIMAARYGSDLVDHMTYVLASDGDLMEGVSHEAAALAGHLGLGKLVVLYDDNSISIDGSTELAYSDDVIKRFAGYGWTTHSVSAHDPAGIAKALQAVQERRRAGADTPTLIRCTSTIGYGAPNMAGSAATHGAALGSDEVAATRTALGWQHPPFEIPEAILSAWRTVGQRGAQTRQAWQARLDSRDAATQDQFWRAVRGAVPTQAVAEAVAGYKQDAAAAGEKLATRKASGKLLEKLMDAVPELVGGSADLTPSNNTKPKNADDIRRGDFSGRYIRYGVREHGMAAAMNGLALHGGVQPYGGSFLTFTDYARPSIRLAALMGLPTIYVMTHDSIGLGEDGPTHQPIEHLAALRAIPNLVVLRPADPVETAECWELALQRQDGPALLALTRQGVPTLRAADDTNRCAAGAYILRSATGTPRVTLYGTGSELQLAVAAAATLEDDGVATQVVSVPSVELFEQQSAAYKAQIVDRTTVRVAVEAAVPQSWHRFVGEDGGTVTLSDYGHSAPYKDVYNHMGLTEDAVVAAVRARLG